IESIRSQRSINRTHPKPGDQHLSTEPQAQSAPRTRNVIWVESKLPWGLDIFLDQDGVDEQSGKMIKIPRPDTRVRLNGANSTRIIGGYGLTQVDADFWAEWMKTHKDFPPDKPGEGLTRVTSSAAIDNPA